VANVTETPDAEPTILVPETTEPTVLPTSGPNSPVPMEVLRDIKPEEPPEGADIQDIATDLVGPVAFAFAPDGRLFFTEKATGRVRVIIDGVLQPEPVVTLPVAILGEQGLIGIAIDPDFESNHYIWVSHTLPAEENNGEKVNRIVRVTEQDNIATEVVTAIEFPNSADSTRHVIGNIAFDDDGMLYVSVGEDNNGSLSQLLSDPRGKILRFEPTIPLIAPEDNPFFDADGPNYDGIYAYGLRNTFDFTFDPFSEENRLFATENGQDCDDEVNRIIAGNNYGWKSDYVCSDDQTLDLEINTILPMLSWSPATAPTGITVYTGDIFPEWKGDVFFCSFQDALLHHLELDETRTGFTSHTVINGMFCQIEVFNGPDGDLYFLEGGGYGNGTLKRLYRP
jgi:glucose/arabinose dehydrogenase